MMNSKMIDWLWYEPICINLSQIDCVFTKSYKRSEDAALLNVVKMITGETIKSSNRSNEAALLN